MDRFGRGGDRAGEDAIAVGGQRGPGDGGAAREALRALTALVGSAAFLIERQVTRPIYGLTHVMSRLARGDLAADIAGIDRRDEMARRSGSARS